MNGLAVHGLFAERTPRRQHFTVRIGQQREGEPLFVAELGQLLGLVGGDAHDIETGAVEFGEAVTEIARLLGAARRRCGWVEVHDDLAARVVGQLDDVAVGIRQAESRGGISHLEARCWRHAWISLLVDRFRRDGPG